MYSSSAIEHFRKDLAKSFMIKQSECKPPKSKTLFLVETHCNHKSRRTKWDIRQHFKPQVVFKCSYALQSFFYQIKQGKGLGRVLSKVLLRAPVPTSCPPHRQPTPLKVSVTMSVIELIPAISEINVYQIWKNLSKMRPQKHGTDALIFSYIKEYTQKQNWFWGPGSVLFSWSRILIIPSWRW